MTLRSESVSWSGRLLRYVPGVLIASGLSGDINALSGGDNAANPGSAAGWLK
ncbi:unnamed protein product [marine sediment metagenome]|uniref:Uncharacterized protein n=1 Tax=marine sediment metagenome TaxID=412755 RepID=X1VDF9_9ZZZZ